MRNVTICFLLTVALAFSGMLYAQEEEPHDSTVVMWEGTSTWEGVKFSITFSTDQELSQVKSLKVRFECIEGVGGVSAQITEPIPIIILRDSSFSFVAEQGSFGNAVYNKPNDQFTGTYKAGLQLSCNEIFYSVKGSWTANRKE